MYAAENASAAVIDRLIAANADISAEDTDHERALDYFSSNTRVQGAERDRIQARLSR